MLRFQAFPKVAGAPKRLKIRRYCKAASCLGNDVVAADETNADRPATKLAYPTLKLRHATRICSSEAWPWVLVGSLLIRVRIARGFRYCLRV